MELWERTTWLNKNIEFLFGDTITEYDMKSAGLSLTKKFKLLPDNIIQDLEKVGKQDRNIRMGLIQKRDKEYTKRLLEAFKIMRKEFFEANNLNEDNLLSIKKDAFFVIDKTCKVTEFDEVKFVPKNKYTSYLYLDKLEFYFNTITKEVDIKGLGQGKILEQIRKAHKDYMLDFMMKYVRMKELGSDGYRMNIFLSDFVKKYRNKELDIGYYRELSKYNAFLVYDGIAEEYGYLADVGFLDDVVIDNNYYNYIVKLVGLCL